MFSSQMIVRLCALLCLMDYDKCISLFTKKGYLVTVNYSVGLFIYVHVCGAMSGMEWKWPK